MLWRQSVELAIKAAITSISDGPNTKLGHNLDEQFARLIAARAELGYCDDDAYTKNVQTMVALVQSFDPYADRFRYPTSRGGQPFMGIAAELDELFQAHWIIVTWCEGAALEVEENRSI